MKIELELVRADVVQDEIVERVEVAVVLVEDEPHRVDARRRAVPCARLQQQAQRLHRFRECARHAARTVVQLRAVTVQRHRDFVRPGEDHPVGALGITHARAVDHRQAAQAERAALAGDREVVFEVEHAFAATDHDGTVRAELGELAQDFAPAGERQITRPVVVVELPEIAVLAAQVAALVDLEKQEQRGREHGFGPGSAGGARSSNLRRDATDVSNGRLRAVRAAPFRPGMPAQVRRNSADVSAVSADQPVAFHRRTEGRAGVRRRLGCASHQHQLLAARSRQRLVRPDPRNALRDLAARGFEPGRRIGIGPARPDVERFAALAGVVGVEHRAVAPRAFVDRQVGGVGRGRSQPRVCDDGSGTAGAAEQEFGLEGHRLKSRGRRSARCRIVSQPDGRRARVAADCP
jgi:hypothetical protein